jgi:hypothetical protein
MDVAAGDGVADAEELEAAVGVLDEGLGPPAEQGAVVDGAEVGGQRLELEVQVSRGRRGTPRRSTAVHGTDVL